MAIPTSMTTRRAWVRAEGKRPVTLAGRPASSTDPGTWASYAQVRSSRVGDGFGVMLGSGIGVYDLDDVSDAQARAFITAIPEPIIYCERSLSGAGVHVFIEAGEAPGSRSIIDGVQVERYTRARFIRMTGQRFT